MKIHISLLDKLTANKGQWISANLSSISLWALLMRALLVVYQSPKVLLQVSMEDVARLYGVSRAIGGRIKRTLDNQDT